MLDKFEVLRKAETYVVNRQFGRAITEYRSLLESKGEDPAILNTLGDLLLKNKQQAEALEHFHRVAQIFIESGFTNKAIAVCKKIHKLDPSDRNTMGQLADLYVKRGFQSQAAKYYKQLVADTRDAGDFPEAVDWQRQLLKVVPDQPEPFAEMAELNLELEDTEGAQVNFVTASWLSFNKGAYQESVDYAEQALAVDGQSDAALRLKEVASRVVVDGESVLADPALKLDADMFVTAAPVQSEEAETAKGGAGETTEEEPIAEPEPIEIGKDATESAPEAEMPGGAPEAAVDDYSTVGEFGGEAAGDQPASEAEITDELATVVEDSESEPETEMVHELSDDIIDNDLQNVEELFKDAAETKSDSEERPEDFGMVEGEPLGELDVRVSGTVDSLERFGEVLGADEAVEASSEPDEEEASKQLPETQEEYSSENDEIADSSIEISIETEPQLEGVEYIAAEEEAAGEPVEEERTEGLVGADEYIQGQTRVETSEEPDAEQTLSSEVPGSQELSHVDEEGSSVTDVVEIPEDIGTLEEPLDELVGEGEAVASPGAGRDEEIFELSVEESAEEVLERLETVPFESDAAGSESEIALKDLKDGESVIEIADDLSSEGLSSVSVEELFEEAVSVEETSELAEDPLEPTLDLDEVEESASGESDSEVDLQGFESPEKDLESGVEVADQRTLDEDSRVSILDQELPHQPYIESESEASQPAWADEEDLAAEPEGTLLAEGQSDEELASVPEEELEHEKAESEEPHSFWDKLRDTVLGRSQEADKDEAVVEDLEQATEVVEATESTGEEVVEERADEEELRLETLETAESEQVEEVEREFEAEEWVEALSSEEVDGELESEELSESEVEEVAQAIDEEIETIEVEAAEESGDSAPEAAGEPEETAELEAVEIAEDRVDEILEKEGVEEEAEKPGLVALEEGEGTVSVEEGASDEQLDLAAGESGETAGEGERSAEEEKEGEAQIEAIADEQAEEWVEALSSEESEEELESVEVPENLTAGPVEEKADGEKEPEPEAWEVFWADTDSECDEETYWTEAQSEEESAVDDLEDQPEAKLEPHEEAAVKASEEPLSFWDKLRGTVLGSSDEVDKEEPRTEDWEEVAEAVELPESAVEDRPGEEEIRLEALKSAEKKQIEQTEEELEAASQEEVEAEPKEAEAAKERIDGVLEAQGVEEEGEKPERIALEVGEEPVSKEKEEEETLERIDLTPEEQEETAETGEWGAEEEIEVEDLVEVATDQQEEESVASLTSQEGGEELESVEAAERDVEGLAEATEEAESIEFAVSEESSESVSAEVREPEETVEQVQEGREEARYEITDLWNRLLNKTLKKDKPEVAVELEEVEAAEDQIDETLETEGVGQGPAEPEIAVSDQSEEGESKDQISEELSVEEESEEERELIAGKDLHDDVEPYEESAPEAAVEGAPEVETLAEESEPEAPAPVNPEKEAGRDYRATITESWKQPAVYADRSPSLHNEKAVSHDSSTSSWPAASDDAENGDGKKDLGSIDEALQEYDFNMKLGLREEAERLISKLLAEHPLDEKVRLRAKSHGISLPSIKEESAPEVEAEGDPTIEDEFESAFEDIFNLPGDEIPEDVLVYELDTADATPSDESKVQFDLGLGYREMGLLDDAIEKFEEAFQVAIDLRDEAHAANCCGMLASTYRELTDYRKVLEWADRGLGLHVAKAFEEKALQYERAQALEMLGEIRQSLDTYRTLMEQDPAFRDVRARVGRLNLLSN